MRTVIGRRQLDPDDGPLLVVVGVFDGLHRGHAYLLEQLVREARARRARPAVITFDAHPDAVLLGHAPPLLMDPAERLERLAAADIELVVVEHFDDALRQTPYDAFLAGITDRCALVGIVMTPDAAFGHDRAGTPRTVGELGVREGFETIVVPPFALDGREVRSSEIRAAISAGDMATAERLLGRPYAITGDIDDAGRMSFAFPIALPPPGEYPVAVNGVGKMTATIAGATMTLGPDPAMGSRSSSEGAGLRGNSVRVAFVVLDPVVMDAAGWEDQLAFVREVRGNQVPDPSAVRSREDFVAFIDALRASLDRALAAPTPGPYEDERGGWTNWASRWAFWEGMTSRLEDTATMDALRVEPIAPLLLEPQDRPVGIQDDLQPFLDAIAAWAADDRNTGSPTMWHLAAVALIGGVVYE